MCIRDSVIPYCIYIISYIISLLTLSLVMFIILFILHNANYMFICGIISHNLSFFFKDVLYFYICLSCFFIHFFTLQNNMFVISSLIHNQINLYRLLIYINSLFQCLSNIYLLIWYLFLFRYSFLQNVFCIINKFYNKIV